MSMLDSFLMVLQRATVIALSILADLSLTHWYRVRYMAGSLRTRLRRLRVSQARVKLSLFLALCSLSWLIILRAVSFILNLSQQLLSQ